jgi:hypothetical protein
VAAQWPVVFKTAGRSSVAAFDMERRYAKGAGGPIMEIHPAIEHQKNSV